MAAEPPDPAARPGDAALWALAHRSSPITKTELSLASALAEGGMAALEAAIVQAEANRMDETHAQLRKARALLAALSDVECSEPSDGAGVPPTSPREAPSSLEAKMDAVFGHGFAPPAEPPAEACGVAGGGGSGDGGGGWSGSGGGTRLSATEDAGRGAASLRPPIAAAHSTLVLPPEGRSTALGRRDAALQLAASVVGAACAARAAAPPRAAKAYDALPSATAPDPAALAAEREQRKRVLRDRAASKNAEAAALASRVVTAKASVRCHSQTPGQLFTRAASFTDAYLAAAYPGRLPRYPGPATPG